MWGRASILVVALAALVGCAGPGVGREDLPSAPIAFIYRTSEEAKKRSELIAPETKPQSRPGFNVLRLKTLQDYLGGASERQQMIDTMGRLAFLDPRTGEITYPSIARAGILPIGWSYDRRQLFFSAIRNRVPQVYAYDLEGQHVGRVTSGDWPQPFASKSLEGRVAFGRITGKGENARSRIFLRDRDGRIRRLTDGPMDYRPVISPDGSVILFIKQLASGREAIARVEPDGGEPRIIARGLEPVFTSDGRSVIYSGRWQGSWDLWRMNPDGTGKHVLGGRRNAVERNAHTKPAVSPDGRFVVYVAEEGGRDKLRLRRIDGTGDRPLVEAGDGGNPVW